MGYWNLMNELDMDDRSLQGTLDSNHSLYSANSSLSSTSFSHPLLTPPITPPISSSSSSSSLILLLLQSLQPQTNQEPPYIIQGAIIKIPKFEDLLINDPDMLFKILLYLVNCQPNRNNIYPLIIFRESQYEATFFFLTFFFPLFFFFFFSFIRTWVSWQVRIAERKRIFGYRARDSQAAIGYVPTNIGVHPSSLY